MKCARITRIGVLAALALGITASAAAAQRRDRFSPSGARGFFMIGVEYMELDELNASLLQRGYPDFDEYFLTLGGGGFAIKNRLLIGGEGHALVQSDKTTTNGAYRTSVLGAYGMFNLGYQVVRAGPLSIYPILGIGAGGATLRIRERAVVSFDDVLQDPGRGATLSNGSLLLGAALGTDWFFGFGSARGGMALGVRAGYNFAPLDSDWTMDGSDVAAGPDAGLTGPYVRVSIGGGRH